MTTTNQHQIEPDTAYLSASELARITNVTAPRLARLIKSDRLRPDIALPGNRLFLFKRDRIDEVRSMLSTK